MENDVKETKIRKSKRERKMRNSTNKSSNNEFIEEERK